MKIGTITYHRARNYGSILQTYALSKYLRCQGHDVETIDFFTDDQSNMYKKYEQIKPNKSGIMSIARNLQTLLYSRQFDEKNKKFNNFISRNIPLTPFSSHSSEDLKMKSISDQFDLFICGSDQIWNTNCGDFAQAYLLDFVTDKSKCCAYAPSIGVTKVEKQSEELFKKFLAHFKKLSVREQNSSVYLGNLIHRNVATVLDPVFLLDGMEWGKLAIPLSIKGRFIFGYYIGDIPGMRKYSEYLARAIHGNVVVINKNLRDIYIKHKIVKYDAGPEEFLWLIKNAELICTNSFHAVAFSLIMNKKFWVFVNRGEDASTKPHQRILNITSISGLESRVVDESTCYANDWDTDIDWVTVNRKMADFIDSAKEYLSECIS